MDQHNAITMDRASSHQHAANLRRRHPQPLIDELASLLVNNIELAMFLRHVDRMIDQLDRLRPVFYANNIHGNIDAQRDACRHKLLQQLRHATEPMNSPPPAPSSLPPRPPQCPPPFNPCLAGAATGCSPCRLLLPSPPPSRRPPCRHGRCIDAVFA